MPVTPVDAPVSPLLSTPGAVAAEGVDAGVAAHYGDPMREQRLLEEGLAVVDLSNRTVVTVSGRDRLTWLHSMTTQTVTGLGPRTSVETLVLSPKGHVEHALHLVDDGSTTWITVEPGTAPSLVAWLESMRFMLRVEVADVSDDYAVLGEPHAAESAPGEPLAWRDPWPDLVRKAFAVPLKGARQHGLAGFLVAGLSPRRPPGEAYESFVDLVAKQIDSAIGEAHHELEFETLEMPEVGYMPFIGTILYT